MHEPPQEVRTVVAGSIRMGATLITPDGRRVTVDKVTRSTHTIRVEGRDRHEARYKRALKYDEPVRVVHFNP
jgi:hypothetical protein